MLPHCICSWNLICKRKAAICRSKLFTRQKVWKYFLVKLPNKGDYSTSTFTFTFAFTFCFTFTCIFKVYGAKMESQVYMHKLDGVGPIDNRPSTISFTNLSKKNNKKNMWHITCDMKHVTRDMWSVTCDMWNVTCDMLWGVNILSKCQLTSSYSLWFLIFFLLITSHHYVLEKNIF